MMALRAPFVGLAPRFCILLGPRSADESHTPQGSRSRVPPKRGLVRLPVLQDQGPQSSDVFHAVPV